MEGSKRRVIRAWKGKADLRLVICSGRRWWRTWRELRVEDAHGRVEHLHATESVLQTELIRIRGEARRTEAWIIW